jgi:hypothetical protein
VTGESGIVVNILAGIDVEYMAIVELFLFLLLLKMWW